MTVVTYVVVTLFTIVDGEHLISRCYYGIVHLRC